MSRSIAVALLLCAGGLVACGDSGSGVAGDKLLVSLNAGEIRKLCEYAVEIAGPERMVDCGDGVTIVVGGDTVAECIASFEESQDAAPSCTATVADHERCNEAVAELSDAALCADEFPAACAPLFTAECVGG